MVLLPALFFSLALVFIRMDQGEPASGWRKAFLFSALISGSYLVFLTEVLSLFQALNVLYIGLGWGIAIVVQALLVIRKIRSGARISLDGLRPGINLATFFVALLALQAAILAMIGIIAPPSNWDALVYHMARVVFWMDHQSVAYYPANTLRQLYQPPFAEYVILHLQVLSGSDRFAFAVQWLSMRWQPDRHLPDCQKIRRQPDRGDPDRGGHCDHPDGHSAGYLHPK